MDKIESISPEEQKAEQEALVEAKEDEVRAEIITEFGFDETEDAERIEKAVEREMKHRKNLSTTIGQKIKYRTKAEELQKAPPKTETKVIPPEDIKKTVDESLDERFEKRDLEAMDYPDELKSEIQKVAKNLGISVKQAAREPYIVFKIEAYEKEQRTEEASVTRTKKGGGKSSWSIDNPPHVDVWTPEGKKIWEEYTTEMKRQGH